MSDMNTTPMPEPLAPHQRAPSCPSGVHGLPAACSSALSSIGGLGGRLSSTWRTPAAHLPEPPSRIAPKTETKEGLLSDSFDPWLP